MRRNYVEKNDFVWQNGIWRTFKIIILTTLKLQYKRHFYFDNFRESLL